MEMKPCPFCGSSFENSSSWIHDLGDLMQEDQRFSLCHFCKSHDSTMLINISGSTKEEVVGMWNLRIGKRT